MQVNLCEGKDQRDRVVEVQIQDVANFWTETVKF